MPDEFKPDTPWRVTPEGGVGLGKIWVVNDKNYGRVANFANANNAYAAVEAVNTLHSPALPEDDEDVVSLDDHRIRADGEFKDESVAYIEALWGKSTFAFNVAVRDLEAMRRGTEEPGMPLRPPATHHEALHMIRHVRALANDIARHFGMDDEVRPDDELPKAKT